MVLTHHVISIYFFLLGACLASFTACAAWRSSRGESVLKGRSHCDSCGHVLGLIDLLPILGWVIRGGKCHYCKAKIPATSCVAEFLTGCSFTFAYWYLSIYEYSPMAWIRFLYICALTLVAVIDAEIGEVPYSFQGVFGILTLLASLAPVNESNWTPVAGSLQVTWKLPAGVLIIMCSLLVSYLASSYIGQGDVVIYASQLLIISPWCTVFSIMISCILSLVMYSITSGKSILVQSDVEGMLPGTGIRLVPSITVSTIIVLIFQPQLYMTLGR